MLYTTLDVLRPAKVAFAPDANDLLLINNSVVQPPEYGHRTELLYDIPKNIPVKADSTSIFCLGALSEDLEGKDFFSSVQLIPNTINKNYSFFDLPTLSDQKVKELCLANHANVILSLDKIIVADDLTENFLTQNSSFLTTLVFKFETYWSIHYLNRKEVTSVHYTDTVYWESESYNRKNAMSDLPDRNDALVDAALNVGHKTVNRFVPYWDKADRYFFNPGVKLMKQGMDSVYVKNWKSAISLWKTEYNSTKNVRIQAQAANNIAIAYEISGDLDNALNYATKAYYSLGKMTLIDFDSYIRLLNYIDELTQRKNELNILKQQLGE
jgi:hypothetical protein